MIDCEVSTLKGENNMSWLDKAKKLGEQLKDNATVLAERLV